MTQHSPLALVTGASRGIGKEIALRLARSGHDIWLTYRKATDEAKQVQEKILALGRECEIMAFDVADYEQTHAALEEKATERPPDAVVINAGVARDNLLMFMSPEEWQTVVGTSLDGFYNVTHAVLMPMLARKQGRIVAISSVSGQVGQAGQVNYSAAKAGLIGAVKALAKEVGKKGILVNAVAPGVIETEMTEHLPVENIKPLIPLQRFGSVAEVASVVHFLCAEPEMYIHGQTIAVNGGLAV